MVFRLLGKLVWGTGKFTVKHILWPMAVTAITAAVLTELAKRVRPHDDAIMDPTLRPQP